MSTPRIKIIWLILGMVGVVVLIFAGIYIYYKGSKPTTASKTAPAISPTVAITGTIDLNGTAPADGLITVSVREFGSSSNSFQIVQNALKPTDNAIWSFPKAEVNKNYEIKADLIQGGKVVSSSDPVFITAPASNVPLRINIIEPPTSSNAIITGTIITNGYIPPLSTITIQGKKVGDSQFTILAKNLPATLSQVMTYSSASVNQEYEVQGQLISSGGQVIGSSDTILVTAPAANEVLQINSLAQPPLQYLPPVAPIISGTVFLNGSVPLGSSVVILARPSGTASYQVVVNGLNPLSTPISWSWNSVNVGQSYDLVAVLKQPLANGNFQDAALSQTITVAAPAQNLNFTINSGFSLPSPNGAITISCGSRNQNNTWSAYISFASVAGAQVYWFQVGSTSGGNDIGNTNAAPSNTAVQVVNATLNDSVTYYARYAYSTQANAGVSQYSPFSGVQGFRCPQ